MCANQPLVYVRSDGGAVEVINLAHVLMVAYLLAEGAAADASVELVFSGEVVDERCARNRREYLGEQCVMVVSQLIELSPRTALVPKWPIGRRVC